jgi:chemotaxis signal transduction protein
MEIIRLPDVVRLPLSPASLEWLANLRGSVLELVAAGVPQIEPMPAGRRTSVLPSFKASRSPGEVLAGW